MHGGSTVWVGGSAGPAHSPRAARGRGGCAEPGARQARSAGRGGAPGGPQSTKQPGQGRRLGTSGAARGWGAGAPPALGQMRLWLEALACLMRLWLGAPTASKRFCFDFN